MREEELLFTYWSAASAERAKSGEEAKCAYLPLEFTIRVESEEIQGQEGSEPDSPSERPQQHSHHHRSSQFPLNLKKQTTSLRRRKGSRPPSHTHKVERGRIALYARSAASAERAKSGGEAKRAYLLLEFTIRVESEEIQGQEGSEPDSPSERPQQHSHHHRSSTVSPELKETDDFHKPKERKPSPPLKPTRLREEELHFTQGVQHQAERAKSGEEAKRAYLPLEFTIRVESEEIQGQEGSEPDSPSEHPQQYSYHHRTTHTIIAALISSYRTHAH
ncbi:hypothetical protein [Paenibacillus sp. MER 78]|uniref:hypothetical protein n=1 Tax=Paenibacillus sp. MER 78 TaxID=2939571 RepID=UPI00203E73EF|nr:hypothetical protein [Paenibacillus sp. MER 78]MCM3129080.1 hypothetical protein [Paenibacillus sp. MER 78]